MGKLPKIFHSDDKIISNNRKSYISYGNIREEEKLYIEDSFYDLFNKRLSYILKNGEVFSGIVVSKRNNELLFSDGKRISINDICSIEK